MGFFKYQRKNKNKLSTFKHIFVMQVWSSALTESLDNGRHDPILKTKSLLRNRPSGSQLEATVIKLSVESSRLRGQQKGASEPWPCSPPQLHQTRWGQHSSKGRLKPFPHKTSVRIQTYCISGIYRCTNERVIQAHKHHRWGLTLLS